VLEPDAIQLLQTWYKAQCNDDWEHHYGVKIDTLDNPGWTVTIDLDGTSKADHNFEKVISKVSERDWFQCWKEGTKFRGVGGPEKLQVILQCFLRFVGD
jgi:Immunity protein 53